MRRATWVLAGLIVLAGIILLSGTNFFTDWLWFKSLGFTGVFWTSFLTNWAVRLTVFALTFLFLLANFGLALRAFKRLTPQEDSILHQLQLDELPLPLLNLAASAVLAFFISAALNPGWTVVQQFLHPVSAGVQDPVFRLDLGYYLFRFPVWQSLNRFLQSLFWVALLGAGLVYWVARAFWRQGHTYALWPQAKTHLTMLAICLFGAKIWGYILARQGLLLTDNGLVTGIDYTAAHVRLPVYNLLALIAALCIAILIAGLFRRGIKLLIGGVGLLLLSSFILGGILPGLVKAIVVKPNEYTKEQAYIERHIESTRRAFGLDRFIVRDYPLGKGSETISLDSPTLSNLRLWDFRLLKLSYEQLQTLRPYYTFTDIDIDRYTIGGRQRQVMLSARELDPSQLPANAQNWVNLHLAYTHGYGVALNSVSEVNQEGQPVFLVGNIPPVVAPGTGLSALKQPQLYFGETQNGYIVVPNGNEEFDYPTETGERRTNYAGRDGVPLSSFWARLLFALRFGDFKILLSEYVQPEQSKVLFYRGIRERVRKLAPFLDLDGDPYIVMADGRLYWIIDAYTYSSYYPYAARHDRTGVNYVRNSVKVIVDAYEGVTKFYIVDETDPIIGVWRRIFPKLFAPLGEMPAGLREHLRYPEGIFRIQRDMLLTYHMTDSKTYFRKEDTWAIPTETHGEAEEELIPYYVTLRLPGQDKGEFVLIQPLRPGAARRMNMVAWMAARCDPEHYGQVLVYLLPKDRIVYGPIQVQGRISQNPEISKLHTLWGQHQSRVDRGNLLVLPFAGDVLYVEPTFIVSNQGQQPELKLVVLVFKDRIVYGSTLPEALAQLTGMAPPSAVPGAATGPSEAKPIQATQDEMVRLIQELEQAIRAQQDAIKRQEGILADLRRQVGR